ncbi:hypothetical protein [Salipaludibacillus aurantiacus]|uniref:Trypsin-like peptidase domain-containing protein n=1 Tax=Salipaludibacillus aurantiacus TaxID=1601833 RepID=A0A1H9VKV8_9BACI|nr:hypothetical protein [Salipaludibacillus aurantiacus]SES22229.1 hypothetical protein SAMN05518684_11160 [Salipaludibacillus aurantiacus]
MPHLSKHEIEKVKKVKTKKNEADFLRKKNVVGVGVGVKLKDGKPTGKPALVTFVTSKKPLESLDKEDVVPEEVDGVETDVVEIGMPTVQIGLEEGNTDTLRTLPSNELKVKIRPVKGGWSVGHPNITAGTAGAVVFNKDETNPAKYYILSNNHVLANSNDAKIGDPILQPGPIDGGSAPDDQVASLSRFIPIDFTPDKPAEEHENLVDAAIAEGSLQELDREVYWTGYIKGWVKKEEVEVGMLLKKTGRTTGYTTAEVLTVDATIDVNFGNNRVARFDEQILTTPFSQGGDSGSLVTDYENRAVGLLFAGSPEVTVLNQIEHVRDLLRIDFV